MNERSKIVDLIIEYEDFILKGVRSYLAHNYGIGDSMEAADIYELKYRRTELISQLVELTQEK